MAAPRPAASTDDEPPPPPVPTKLGPEAENERFADSLKNVQDINSSLIQAVEDTITKFPPSQDQIDFEEETETLRGQKEILEREASKLYQKTRLLESEARALDQEAKRLDARLLRLLRDARSLADETGDTSQDAVERMNQSQEEERHELERQEENDKEIAQVLREKEVMAGRRRQVLEKSARLGNRIDGRSSRRQELELERIADAKRVVEKTIGWLPTRGPIPNHSTADDRNPSPDPSAHSSSQQRPNGGGIREDGGGNNSGNSPVLEAHNGIRHDNEGSGSNQGGTEIRGAVGRVTSPPSLSRGGKAKQSYKAFYASVSDDDDDDDQAEASSSHGRAHCTASPVDVSGTRGGPKRRRAASDNEESRPSKKARRTIEFDEIFDDGAPEHRIVEYPKGSNMWYILRCELHDKNFNSPGHRALRGAGKHLNGAEHNEPGTDENVIRKLGVEVMNCHAAKVDQNNRAFLRHHDGETSGARSRRPQTQTPGGERAFQPRGRTNRPASEDDVSRGLHSQPPVVGGSPVPGEVYQVLWPLGPGRYKKQPHAAVVLPTGSFRDIGISGHIRDTKLMAKISKKIYRVRRGDIIGWQDAYRDGEDGVVHRQYPVMFFEEDTVVPLAGEFKMPPGKIWNWLYRKDLRPLELGAEARQVAGHQAAVNFMARLELVREGAVRDGRREGHVQEPDTSGSEYGYSGPRSEASIRGASPDLADASFHLGSSRNDDSDWDSSDPFGEAQKDPPGEWTTRQYFQDQGPAGQVPRRTPSPMPEAPMLSATPSGPVEPLGGMSDNPSMPAGKDGPMLPGNLSGAFSTASPAVPETPRSFVRPRAKDLSGTPAAGRVSQSRGATELEDDLSPPPLSAGRPAAEMARPVLPGSSETSMPQPQQQGTAGREDQTSTKASEFRSHVDQATTIVVERSPPVLAKSPPVQAPPRQPLDPEARKEHPQDGMSQRTQRGHERMSGDQGPQRGSLEGLLAPTHTGPATVINPAPARPVPGEPNRTAPFDADHQGKNSTQRFRAMCLNCRDENLHCDRQKPQCECFSLWPASSASRPTPDRT